MRQRFNLASADISFDVVPEIVEEPRQSRKDYSKPVGVRKLTLMTDSVQRVFSHFHVRLDYSMFLLTKVQRQQRREPEAEQAEKMLDKLFTVFSADIQRTESDLERLIAEKHLLPITYDHKRMFSAPIRTGFANRFIEVTEHLDKVIALIETLELACEMPPAESAALTGSWLKRYRAFCHSINGLRAKLLPSKNEAADTESNAGRELPSQSGETSPQGNPDQAEEANEINAESAERSPQR